MDNKGKFQVGTIFMIVGNGNKGEILDIIKGMDGEFAIIKNLCNNNVFSSSIRCLEESNIQILSTPDNTSKKGEDLDNCKEYIELCKEEQRLREEIDFRTRNGQEFFAENCLRPILNSVVDQLYDLWNQYYED